MPRIAEWREPPVDARSWDRVWKRLRSYPWTIWPAILLVALISVLWFFDDRWGLAKFVASCVNNLLMLLLMGSLSLVGLIARKRPPPELGIRMDDPPIGPQCATTLTLSYGKTPYATDRGVVTLYDGWLHFEGLETSFSLDAACLVERGSHLRTVKTPSPIDFALADYPVRISMHPFGEADQRQFVGAFYDWHYQAMPVKGELIYPPVKAKPSWRPFLSKVATASLLGALFLSLPTLLLSHHWVLLKLLCGLSIPALVFLAGYAAQRLFRVRHGEKRINEALSRRLMGGNQPLVGNEDKLVLKQQG